MTDAWAAFPLVFARVAAVAALHPVLGGRSLPRPVVAGIAAATALACLPASPVAAPAGAALVACLAREVAVGAAIAVVGLATFGAIEAAGRFVDDARGAGFAALYAPLVETPTSPLGQLDAYAALALYWALGLHAALLGVVTESFAVLPVGESALPASLAGRGGAEAAAEVAAALARAGLALGGPAAACCLAADLLVGLVSRTAPAANLTPLGLSAKLLAAVALLALSAPARGGLWVETFEAHHAWLRAVIAP